MFIIIRWTIQAETLSDKFSKTTNKYFPKLVPLTTDEIHAL